MIFKAALMILWFTPNGYGESYAVSLYRNPVQCEMQRHRFERFWKDVGNGLIFQGVHARHVFVYCATRKPKPDYTDADRAIAGAIAGGMVGGVTSNGY